MICFGVGNVVVEELGRLVVMMDNNVLVTGVLLYLP